MTEKLSSAARPRVIIAAFAFLLLASIVIYACFPLFRDHLKFWIPQVFLLILIVVTTLYVFYTSALVEETRRLQQRPLLEVSFVEVPVPPEVSFQTLYKQTSALLEQAAHQIGHVPERIDTKCLVLELKNIGQATARYVSISVAVATPDGKESNETVLIKNIEKDGPVRVAIAPAALPWIAVNVEAVSYSDGLQKYNDIQGKRTYQKEIREPRLIVDEQHA